MKNIADEVSENESKNKSKTTLTFIEAADSLRESMMYEAADNIEKCVENLKVIQEAIGE